MSVEVLSAALELELVRALNAEWRDLNWFLFGSLMRPPVLSLSDTPGVLGQWRRDTRELRIHRKMACEESWGVVEEVLKHEMAHQFVDEVLGKHDESAHGPAFRQVCEDRAIDPGAAGLPKAAAEAQTRVFERVSKLLALAGSANQHEAETAMAKAQELMRAHNVEAVRTRAERRYHFERLGTPTQRVHEPARWLARIVADHFFVEVIWVQVYLPHEGVRASVLEACGAPENLAIAAYVHGFLEHTAERLWREHKAQGRVRGQDRLRFITGVMRGFKEKLEGQQVEGKGKGLIWVKDGDLQRHMGRRYPRTTKVHRVGTTKNAAFHAGRAAGQGIVLNKPMTSGGGGGGRLLGPGRS
jgi:predicted SprT family Zn-dependent metalloprotease